MLDCDPLGTNIALYCVILPLASIVSFYWTQNVCDAGVSGSVILLEDTSDNYQEDPIIGTWYRTISFTVSESTFGYYWCEISNAVNESFRPSTITAVCPLMNSSQSVTKHISAVISIILRQSVLRRTRLLWSVDLLSLFLVLCYPLQFVGQF